MSEKDMAEESVIRKLAAILYADVAGYSRLTGVDEIGTHRQLSVSLDLMTDRIRNSGGRVMHYAGDALLAVNFLAHGFAARHGTNGRTCFATAIGITEL